MLSCIDARSLPYMRIYERRNAHIWKLSSVYAHSTFRVCAYTEGRMHIYGSSLPYMHMLLCAFCLLVHAHIRKPTGAYTEESVRICACCLLYMHIYGRRNAHIRKLSSIYARTFTEGGMRIYGSFPPYMHALFRICACWLPYMRIYGRRNAHKSACIYRRELPYMHALFHICALSSVYAHL